jgi:ATP adenylyltransferase
MHTTNPAPIDPPAATGPESYPRVPLGGIRTLLQERSRQALASGALHSIATEQCRIQDRGLGFLVRSVSSLRHKPREPQPDQPAGAPRPNPFLPPEPALTLGALPPDHLLVLNKFNVLEQHLLIVTRTFVHQESLLTEADFAALWQLLGEIDGLGFYNGGRLAGASQTHKHLQLVPLPLDPAGPAVPLEPLLADARGERVAGLPFAHGFRALPAELWSRPQQAAAHCLELYRQLLAQVGIGTRMETGEERQSAP